MVYVKLGAAQVSAAQADALIQGGSDISGTLSMLHRHIKK
jgi:hypothetical protein